MTRAVCQPLAGLSDFVLHKLGAELRWLLKAAPVFGNTLAQLVAEELTRRVQGCDPLGVDLPTAGLYEAAAVSHWARHTRALFEMMARDAPELRAQFEKAVEFIQRIEARL